MSRRPPLGVLAIAQIAESLKKNPVVWDRMFKDGVIPHEVHLGGRAVPLGKYLRSQLLDYIGFTKDAKEAINQKVVYEKSLEMLDMFKAAFDPSKVQTYQTIYNRENQGRIIKAEAKHRIFRPAKSL